ncbi:phosphoglycerate dehydrogenase [uncultured Tessaracoccus sp.]|uniref:phosphoglycerate dehydrogenase n=1 Tax=uncultured Tessaracoccus sp. TaxID=905023 RepID=UPI00261B0397|nr:phosphoglycerate dehydrogenase [uncultured Tessaracoccus sp.]
MNQRILITPKSFTKYKAVPVQMLEDAGYDIEFNETGHTLSAEELIERASNGVVGIIVGVDPISQAVVDACADLRAVSKYGVGMDNIDLPACKAKGIAVDNARGTNSISVAELAVGLMFEGARRMSEHIRVVRNGGWGRTMGAELTGKRVGIVGGGQIGRAVAERCVGLAMDVQVYDPFLPDDASIRAIGATCTEDLDALFSESDVVSLHLPVTDETRHLVNAERLATMKPTAILINTARGELVDEDALHCALREGALGFAGQDVFSQEPPSADHPLLQLPNFVLTPHLGAFTGEAVERMAVTSTENLLRMLRER